MSVKSPRQVVEKTRPLAEHDLPEAQRIVRRAFGTFLGAPDLDTFWTDFDYVYGRFGAEHTVAFAADADGALAGVNFANRWGASGSSVLYRPGPICGTAASPNLSCRLCPMSSTPGVSGLPGCAHFRTAPSMCGYTRSSGSTRVI